MLRIRFGVTGFDIETFSAPIGGDDRAGSEQNRRNLQRGEVSQIAVDLQGKLRRMSRIFQTRDFAYDLADELVALVGWVLCVLVIEMKGTGIAQQPTDDNAYTLDASLERPDAQLIAAQRQFCRNPSTSSRALSGCLPRGIETSVSSSCT